MSEAVFYSVQDGVAYLAVSNPPVNALSQAMRAGLLSGLRRAEADAEVQEVVLIGRGRSFPTGADVGDLDRPEAAPTLATLCDAVEAAAKPVVAAVHGLSLGGGFELTLAAHYRVAHAAAQVGFPEARLGLAPHGGGSQRAPRLAGAGATLDMMLSAQPCPVRQAPAEAFFDKVVEGDLAEAALAFCHALRAAGQGPRPTRDVRAGFAYPAAYQAQVAEARERIEGLREPAASEIVDLVEAAMLLPFDAGRAREAAAFEDLVASDVSRALRHAYVAERTAATRFAPQDVAAPEIRKVCVLGGGSLAIQIAAAALQAGLRVQWGTREALPREEGAAQVRSLFQHSVARGAIGQDKADALLAGLTLGDSAQMTTGADIILHAARGQGNVPAPEGVPRAVAMPERVDELGLRFALPVYSARLVEVVEGPGISPAQIAAGLALAQAMNKVAVRVVSTGDSIAGRMAAALHRAADGLVDIGQSPAAIDAALRVWGWTRPPFETRDALGLAEFAARPRPGGAHNWSALLLEAGRAGRKTGGGFYAYPAADGPPQPTPDAEALIDAVRPRTASRKPADLALLIVGALANEGARMLAEGWVRRPADVDVAMMLAHDFPRWRGGPMQAADAAGLFSVQRALERAGAPDAEFWTPQPLLRELVKNGRRFASLNG